MTSDDQRLVTICLTYSQIEPQSPQLGSTLPHDRLYSFLSHILIPFFWYVWWVR